MPDGKTHKKYWAKFWILPLGAFIVSVFFNWYMAVWIFVGYGLHGWLGITNDLDLISINDDEAKWIRSVILMPLLLWSTLYSRIMQGIGGHRGFWSHSFFISSFIRLMWFGFPFILVFRYFFSDPLYIEFFGMLIGLSIADGLHTVLDMSSGEMNFGSKKKLFRRKRK